MTHRRITLLLLLLCTALGCAAQERLKIDPGKIRARGLGVVNADSNGRVVTKLKPIARPQKGKAVGHYTFGTLLDGDTVPLYHLREVVVYASGMLLTDKEIKNNKKLIRNVRLMLPYAREAKRRLDILEVEIANLPKKERKAAIKKAEKQLTADYKEDLSRYTFSQGLVLIKLIDRETNRTAYSIVGELRGSFRAGLYQTFARLFGFNLKTHFDPEHDKKDDLIERIVRSIERGQL
jgi:hypothetical protein